VHELEVIETTCTVQQCKCVILIVCPVTESYRGAYMVVVGKPEGKRSLGRPRRSWEDNFKMEFEDVGLGGLAWTGSLCLEDRNKCEHGN